MTTTPPSLKIDISILDYARIVFTFTNLKSDDVKNATQTPRALHRCNSINCSRPLVPAQPANQSCQALLMTVFQLNHQKPVCSTDEASV